MKRFVRICMVLCILCCSRYGMSADGKFEPQDGKCLVFVGQELEAVGGVDGFDGYIDHFGTPAGITIYTNLRPGDVSYGYTYKGLDGLSFESDWGAGICHADKQLASPSMSGCDVAIGLELVNHENRVARGEHDHLIEKLAEWIKGMPSRRFFLRIGYEFDGHAWNHYEPEGYVLAFRRIHDMLDSLGVTNVAYVWQSEGTNKDVEDILSYYPGDGYVDWFAYSHFAKGRSQVMIDLARKHGKPVFIAESTPMFSREGSPVVELDLSDPEQAVKAWNTWFADLFATIEENPDVVKAVSYINCNWPSQPMWQADTNMFSKVNARLQDSPYISKLWKAKMADPEFIHEPAGGDRKMDEFISSLMQDMTLEEKIGQFSLPTAGDFVTGEAGSNDVLRKIKEGRVGALYNIDGMDKIREAQRIAVEESRLKIPLLFARDVIHGYKTAFPIPLAMACSWDMGLIEETAATAAKEATADGLNWTFSPMTDISRDPRWGRVAEGAGEDPYLGAEVAKAMVRGYQGDNTFEDNTRMLACVKHFALYGASESGRDYNTVDMSRIRMFNEYMLPYRAAVDAGVATVMTSFNEIDGIPASGNRWLLEDVLREEWGFEGFVVSDYTAVTEMCAHGLGDTATVAALAMNAGVDMEMVSESYRNTLAESCMAGKVEMSRIDEACRKILEAKYRLGLFDDPYKYCDAERNARDIYSEENLAMARMAAGKTFVLLKNEGNILPLERKGRIAVVGPLADTGANMPGMWSPSVDRSLPETVLEGIRAVAGDNVEIVYAKGSNLISDPEIESRATVAGCDLGRDSRTDEELLSEALKIAAGSDVILAVLGESAEMSGESASRTDPSLPDVQKRLLESLLDTGKPVCLILFTGRPLVLTWEQEHVPAILNVWFGGSMAARAVGDVVFGDVNPSGKLVCSFPRSVGQIPVYYNHKNTGRPEDPDKPFEKFRSNYLDSLNEPLYPFGFGLSYTAFEYSSPELDRTEMDKDEKITVRVTVTNTGDRAGEEVVQLYIRDISASVTRPVKELKGFRKVYIEPGESREVVFEIDRELLMFYDWNLDYVCEPGEYEVTTGPDSNNVRSAKFTLLR